MIDRELAHLSDPEVLANIRSLLVEPEAILRDWVYGPPGQQYPCWAVLNDDPRNSNTGIVYCEHGFGPERPWALVRLDGDDMSLGTDCEWYSRFLDAYFESFASTMLPKWRVVRIDSPENYTPITDQGCWDERWKQVEEFRKENPASSFSVHHTISYKPDSNE